MTAISGALVFAMLGVSTTAGMFIFALVYGFFSGSCTSTHIQPTPMTDYFLTQSSLS